ncbi:MAG: neuraminidase-like domain-containing protein [Myxococcota bacterium]
MNNSTHHPINRTALPQSRGSSRQVAQKRTQRETARRASHPIPFAQAAQDPLFQALADATCPEHLKKDIQQLGMANAADVVAYRSAERLNAELRSRSGGDDAPQTTPGFFDRAKREAQRCYRLMQHLRAVKDPMNQGLLHTASRLSAPVERAYQSAGRQSFAKPTSLQSNQSVAAYLRHLYRIATGLDSEFGIQPPEDGPFRLTERRPDLAELVLSDANLKQEIPTVRLVNEVLQVGLRDIEIDRAFFPIALPFDESAASTRTALKAAGHADLNAVFTRTASDSFPLRNDFCAVGDIGGVLGLTGAPSDSSAMGSELSLLTESVADQNDQTPRTLQDLYGTQEIAALSDLGRLQRCLDLDFDAMAQLLGLYEVRQESGEAVEPDDFATPWFGQTGFVLVDYRGAPQVWTDGGPLVAPDLRSLHYLARLHHATGLAFHALNLLLAIPGASAEAIKSNDDERAPRSHLTATGLRVLTSFIVHRERFDLDPETYAAMLHEVSPYWRAGQVIDGAENAIAGLEQTEVSFMRKLFGDDAPWLHRTVVEGSTPVTDDALAAVLQRGLEVSSIEFDALVEALDAGFGLKSGLDARGLGGLYRLSQLFRVLGWPILRGLEFVLLIDGSKVNETLWPSLSGKNTSGTKTEQLCTAIEQLFALHHWMSASELSLETAVTLLTPIDRSTLRASDADHAWLRTVRSAAAPTLIQEQSFRDFETWIDAEGQTLSLAREDWHAHFVSTETVYRASGVFLAEIEREVIDGECRAYLVAQSIDLEEESNHDQLDRLVEHLFRLYAEQLLATEVQVASLSPDLTELGAGALIEWAQARALDLLETWLADGEETDALFWLYELRRYAAVDSTLELGDIGLWLAGYAPTWVSKTADPALDLERLYALQRFSALQVGPANDAAWRGYLILSREVPTDAEAVETWRTACVQALALLLGCPVSDALAYVEDLFGAEGVPNTLHAIDAVARHVRLAAELQASAPDLLTLKKVSDTSTGHDWSTAEAAARAALSRTGEDNTLAYENALSEQKRDGMVAAYMQTRIAADATLASEVVDRESLYRHLLLDVKVTSAVPTSRLVEAMHSLQLYISRALGGLEPGVTFANRDALAAQWQIDKSYRLWEANQKLALYPQNYIEPELRYQSSPEFDRLLQEVSGSDLDENSAEAAVNGYMAELAGVCSLSVCSMYTERLREYEERNNTNYHVLARADWEPDRYFYRKLEADYRTIDALEDKDQYLKALDWTFWREVTVPKTFELLSDVTVCVFQNRYYFFWLEVEERKNQGSSGKESQWRIYPRYMRCDANALTGPTYTPVLFLGDAGDRAPDGVFEWLGSRPTISTVYHPVIAEEPCTYGQAAPEPDSPLETVLFTTFGLELRDTDGKIAQRSSLQLRLTDAWADATFFRDTLIDTRLQENAPERFACIHPVLTDMLIEVGRNKRYSDHSLFNMLTTTSEGPTPSLRLFDRSWVNSWNHFFTPPSASGISVGSVTAKMATNLRELRIETYTGSDTDPSGYFTGITANPTSETQLETILRVNEDGLKESSTGRAYKKKDMRWYPADIDDIAFDQRRVQEHEFRNQDLRHSVATIPKHWVPKLGETRKIEVEVRIQRSKTRYVMAWKTDDRNGQIEIPYNTYVPAKTNPIGEITLRSVFPRRDTAWAQRDEHMSRNFLHISFEENSEFNDTLVLLNSSSALTELARSMPRPGGIDGLFTPENQLLPEELGSFVDDLALTLSKAYPDADVAFGPTPGDFFDFDAAYGGYGWEIFYHIPSALAASYADAGRFDDALRWFEKIFDPKRSSPWRVQPLATATEPDGALAFDTGDVIVDPDRIATDYPFYYQQATIRQYLETMLAAGDAAYKEQTQETLQQAKAHYVAAKQLFRDRFEETLNVIADNPWTEPPKLGDVIGDNYTGFLPPYNRELRTLYATIDDRLDKLRRWVDLEGNPLNIPLLAPAIDPRRLQLAAKASLSSGALDFTQQVEKASLVDFTTLARTVRHYLGNLKTTSERLLVALEKVDNSRLVRRRIVNENNRIDRSETLQKLAVKAAEKLVDVKQAHLVTTTSAATNYVAGVLSTMLSSFLTGNVQSQLYNARRRVVAARTKINNSIAYTQAFATTILGTSNGGQAFVEARIVAQVSNAIDLLDAIYSAQQTSRRYDNRTRQAEVLTKATELTSQIAAAGLEVTHAGRQLAYEEKALENLGKDVDDATELLDVYDAAITGESFYASQVDELEKLLQDEWAVTLEFCLLLAQVFDDCTCRNDGASFIQTRSLGTDNERLNAPYRLALDVEKLEVAYVESVLDTCSQSTQMRFTLSELRSCNAEGSALQALLEHGEADFELTEDMFDVLYPGQYDRRVQSVKVRFPGLREADLSPHARLTQIGNTRYTTRERDPLRGGRIRRDRYALQSVVLGAAEVDTSAFEHPEGLLKCFQNTGVESRWRLEIPALAELKRNGKSRGKAWRAAAGQQIERLVPHLDEVEFEVTFSGRWN